MTFISIVIIVIIILFAIVFIILGRYHLSDITQTKIVKLTAIEPDALNFFDKFRLHDDLIPEQIFKTDKKLGDNRVRIIRFRIMGEFKDKFDVIREQIKNEPDFNKQIEIYREYERQCLSAWKDNRIEIDPMTDEQIKTEVSRLKIMKQLNPSLSKLRLYQNILDFKCIVPLGWFYHWDLIDERYEESAIKLETFNKNISNLKKGIKSIF